MYSLDGRGIYAVDRTEAVTEGDRNRHPRQEMNSCVSVFIRGALSVAARQMYTGLHITADPAVFGLPCH